MPKFIRGDIVCLNELSDGCDDTDNHICTFICYKDSSAYFFLHSHSKTFSWSILNFDKFHDLYKEAVD